MRIKMLKTQSGAPEGTTTHIFEKGVEYDLPDCERGNSLCEVFVAQGWAVRVHTNGVKAPSHQVTTPVPPVEVNVVKDIENDESAEPAEVTTETFDSKKKKKGK